MWIAPIKAHYYSKRALNENAKVHRDRWGGTPLLSLYVVNLLIGLEYVLSPVLQITLIADGLSIIRLGML